MTKRKTTLQESIVFWENQYRLWVELGSVGNDGNLMEYFIRHLKSKLPQEKQDLIQFGYRCIGEVDCEIGDLTYNKVPEEIYLETFENEN